MVNRETRATKPREQPAAPSPIWRHLLMSGGQLGREWHPVLSGGLLVEPPPDPTALGEAQLVENGFMTRSVGRPSHSRFEFFLDGIEYTRVAGYIGTVPVVHGYVAAVIRRRSERAFATWDRIEEEVLAFSHQALDPRRLVDLGLPERCLIDSDEEGAEAHPIRLAELGRAAVKRRRARAERRLGRRWAEEGPGDGWLLVDGPLAIDPLLQKSGRAIGLVKSHRTQFLTPELMSAVLGMAGGVRSPVFKPIRPAVGEVYSWYARLRPTAGHDIYWGLVRVEGPAADATVEAADEISRWLLAEAAPISLPDWRWDVLLYPIRDCEQYLRARMPTLEVS